MRIAELFYSIQGEGKLAGVPSVFVRVSGCNLRCTWCDTPYASWDASRDSAPEKTVEQVAAEVLAHRAPHVVLTGGEPMMFAETVELMRKLKTAGEHITVETAGTLWPRELEAQAGIAGPLIDLASVSPKLANSTPHQREGGRFALMHESQRINLDILRRFASQSRGPLIGECQWKFVVSRMEDLAEIEELLQRINAGLAIQKKIEPPDVLLMPEGIDAPTLAERSLWLAELCKQTGYRFCPRLHVQLWGNTRGT